MCPQSSDRTPHPDDERTPPSRRRWDPRHPPAALRRVLVGAVWVAPGILAGLLLSLACPGEFARVLVLIGAITGFVCGYQLERCPP